MVRKLLSTSTVTSIIVALAACQTTTPDAGGAGPGWRKGLVVQVGDAVSLGPPIDSDCRSEGKQDAKPDAGPARRFVEVQYFVGRHAHLRIVPIDGALQVSVGDAIYVRSFGCANARTVVAGT